METTSHLSLFIILHRRYFICACLNTCFLSYALRTPFLPLCLGESPRILNRDVLPEPQLMSLLRYNFLLRRHFLAEQSITSHVGHYKRYAGTVHCNRTGLILRMRFLFFCSTEHCRNLPVPWKKRKTTKMKPGELKDSRRT